MAGLLQDKVVVISGVGPALVDELRAIGLGDVILDDNGYLMATIPATTVRGAATIGFIAHVDTSPEMPGAGVKPLVHRAWAAGAVR